MGSKGTGRANSLICVLDINVAESAKGFVHLGLLALAGLCAGYNLAALWHRKKPYQRHLIVNALCYTTLALYEIRQVHCHWQASRKYDH